MDSGSDEDREREISEMVFDGALVFKGPTDEVPRQ